MDESEYRELVKRLRASNSNTTKYALAAYYIFQFHMMARVDDVAMFQAVDLTPCPEFSFCLQAQMKWSKNVMEERDAPNQILLAAQDPNF